MDIDISTENIKKQIDNLKKRTRRVYMLMIALSVLITVFVIGAYEIRIRAVTGNVYRADENASRLLINCLFDADYSAESFEASRQAVKAAGYTENGFAYLYDISGQWIILVAVIAVAAAMIFVAVTEYIRMSRINIYSGFLKLSEENDRLRDEIKTNVAYMEKRNRQLQNFIENIAHQVKTPLTAMSLILDMGGTPKDCFFHIERIKEFIQRLLKISRMESGKVIFAREDMAIGEVIEEAIAASGVSRELISAECEGGDCVINGDREWLKEAFINIIANSAEYIKKTENGKISISIRELPDRCIVFVSDNGPGFSEGEEEKIFDRFETRGDSNAFHTGIGLNLSKLIIEAHKGAIHAGNALDKKGAEFKIVLPKYALKKKNQAAVEIL